MDGIKNKNRHWNLAHKCCRNTRKEQRKMRLDDLTLFQFRANLQLAVMSFHPRFSSLDI